MSKTLNSLIVKCSKLTKAVRVYRGMSRGVLPQSFWDENEHGVRGGVEDGRLAVHQAHRGLRGRRQQADDAQEHKGLRSSDE